MYQVIDGQQRIATLMALCGEIHNEIASQFPRLQPTDQEALKHAATRQLQALEASLRVRLSDSGTESLPRMIRGNVDTWGKHYGSAIANYLHSFGDASGQATETGDRTFDACLKTIRETLKSSELFHNRIRKINDSQWANLFSEQPPPQLPTSPEAFKILRFLTFSAFMMNNVQIVAVEADNSATAAAVFEPLNTTGESLTAFETFVPLVVYNSGGDEQYSQSESSKQLARFENLLELDHTVDIATRTQRALVTFALVDNGTKIGQDPHVQRRHLRQYLLLDDPAKSTFLKGLGDTGEFLHDFWYQTLALPTTEDRERTSLALAMLKDSQHTIPQALLVRAYRECLDRNSDTNSLDALYDLIELVASFWVLWRLSRSTTDNVDSHYRHLMCGHEFGDHLVGPYCQRPETSRAARSENVRTDFRAILQEAGDIDGMNSWIDRVVNVPHGEQSNSTVLKYALMAAYQDAHAEASSPPYFSDTMAGVSSTLSLKWYRMPLSIEHIAPQSQGTSNGFHDEIYSGGHLHKIGNLTLVPLRENSSLGDKTWEEKRQHYRVFCQTNAERRAKLAAELSLRPETVDLLMENYIPFCIDLARYPDTKTTWKPKDVRRRGTGLAERIWQQFAPSLGW